MTSYLIIRINVSFKIKKIRSDRKTVNKVKKDSGKKNNMVTLSLQNKNVTAKSKM